MRVIASDGKDFVRSRFQRDENDQLIIDEEGRALQKAEVGFFSPLGVTIHIEDSDAFLKAFHSAWKEAKSDYGVLPRRHYASAQSIMRREMQFNMSKALALLYGILNGVKDHIDKVLINWVILPKDRIPVVMVGGRESAERPIAVSDFKRQIGNIFPALSAWSYCRGEGTDFDVAYVDDFQGKTTNAWLEFIEKSPKTQVIPKGDECNPFVCIADILAYLTDKRMGANRLKLFPDQVKENWEDYPFEVKTFFFDENNIKNIKWRDETPLDNSPFYPTPMVYLLVDSRYMDQSVADIGDPVKMKNFASSKGFTELPMTLAQELNGGTKGYHEMDRHNIKDGDYLIYMGQDSEIAAKGYSHALDIKAMSIVELRKELRERGLMC